LVFFALGDGKAVEDPLVASASHKATTLGRVLCFLPCVSYTKNSLLY
jgi:hypothetical protein